MSDELIEVPYDWSPRSYQMPAWTFLEHGGKRADLCWHRKSGKDLFALSWTVRSAMMRPGIYWHILPKYSQARKTVWDGRTNAGLPYLNVFGPEKGGIIAKKKENEMMIEFINDSIWQIQGADEPDRLVGPNPVGVVFSEWSLMTQEIYTLTIQPILESNGGWALFIYTMRGENHAYQQRERMKDRPDWFVEKLTIDDTRDETGRPIVTPEQVEKMREEGTPEPVIQQEYYCSSKSPVQGSYYENEMTKVDAENRICEVPWEQRLEVFTSWDLGIDDATVIWFFQEYGNQIRVIDLEFASGEGLPYYAKKLRERPYIYGAHYGPHDIEVRELGTAASRRDTARKLGIPFRVVPRHSVADGIDAVRGILNRCWFDKKKCHKGTQALKTYHKQWDAENQRFLSEPVHDWSSDFADAFRIFAMGHRTTQGRKKGAGKAKGEYPVFGS